VLASRKTTSAALTAILAVSLLALPGTSSAVAPDPNPWLGKGFLNIAHQGGEDEAPSNTLFALKTAVSDRGADSIELDVNLTSDGELVVIHDDTYIRTTCNDTLCQNSGTEPQRPQSEVNDLTLAELQALDAGYWFRPGTYSHNYSLDDSAYPYRGIATGAVPPPTGYTDDDFKVPTLEEVLDAFPDTPINIEIKMIKTTPEPPGSPGGCVTQGGNDYCDDPTGSIPVAEALADLLNQPAYSGRDDIIVVSFSDLLVQKFHERDDDVPPEVALAPGFGGIANYLFTGQTLAPPAPEVAAFQVPPRFNFVGTEYAVPDELLGATNDTPQPTNAHADEYAVHVWPNGLEPESEASYARLHALGIEGYMASEPGRLHDWLCSQGIRRPDGTLRGPGCTGPPPTTPTVTPSTSSPVPAACKKGQKLKGGKCVKKKKKRKRKRR
jgi:glycerophosphoryl diester phosphodiesterase